MKIVFLDSYSLGDADLSPISSLGDYTQYDDTPLELVIERSHDAHVVITNKVRLFKNEIDALNNLQLICVAATGTNNIDTVYAQSKGIKVMNVPAYSTQSVAEATFAMTLALLRNVVFYDRYVKDGSYASSNRCFNLDRPITQIHGKRWGIIGMGNIGKQVATIASAFGAQVFHYSTSGQNTVKQYEQLSLEELLRTSDIISIHAPLNERTERLITRLELQMMKPNAIIINVGRGKIIDEHDLAQAINQNIIAGAAIDVFENEPIQNDNPLLRVADSDKLIMAPHCAWSSEQARQKLVQVIAENILSCNF